MSLVGQKSQGIREVLFYLAKYMPDLERGEPRNIGLIIRRAESPTLAYKFLAMPSFLAPEDGHAFQECTVNWQNAMEKHQNRSLHFIGKRQGNKYANPKLYIELAFTRMVAGRVNIDAAFTRLVSLEGRSHG